MKTLQIKHNSPPLFPPRFDKLDKVTGLAFRSEISSLSNCLFLKGEENPCLTTLKKIQFRTNPSFHFKDLLGVLREEKSTKKATLTLHSTGKKKQFRNKQPFLRGLTRPQCWSCQCVNYRVTLQVSPKITDLLTLQWLPQSLPPHKKVQTVLPKSSQGKSVCL